MTSERIWRFSDPRDDRFAAAGRRGAWSDVATPDVCSTCSGSRQVRAQPLVMVWETGSDVVGDFTWPGFDSEVVVTDDVLAALGQFEGFEAGPVEIVEDAEASKRGKRVQLHGDGGPLHELWVSAVVAMDRDRSTAELAHTCGECDAEQWELYGVERWDSHFDPDLKRLIRVKSERLPRAGIYVRGGDLAGAGIFRVEEFPAWIFCVDAVREVIEGQGFSNVSFLEMGETF
jgi:hypothetical protein